MKRTERKKQLITALAIYLAQNQAAKSIALELEHKKPPLPGMPLWASEWAKIHSIVNLRGYASVQEAIETLEEIL